MCGVVQSPLVLSAVAGIAWSLTDRYGTAGGAGFLLRYSWRRGAAGCALRHWPLHGRPLARGRPPRDRLARAAQIACAAACQRRDRLRLVAMDHLWASAVVTLAALPTGALVFVLAQQYGI